MGLHQRKGLLVIKIQAYQVAAVVGSSILMLSGLLRFQHSGSPKELVIGILYFIANLLIFCL
jgi:hypothetical protein